MTEAAASIASIVDSPLVKVHVSAPIASNHTSDVVDEFLLVPAHCGSWSLQIGGHDPTLVAVLMPFAILIYRKLWLLSAPRY